MAKPILPAIALLVILLVILSGCMVRSPSSSNTQDSGQQQTPGPYSPYHLVATPTETGPIKSAVNDQNNLSNITPMFTVGQIAATSSSGATSGLAIVDYNDITKMYGTLAVTKDGRGDSWHTDGYQLVEWKNVKDVDRDYRSSIGSVMNPTYIPEFDPTVERNVFLSMPCDVVGDWNVNNGASIYKFRLDRIVVNQTGNQTVVGTWAPVNTNERRTFVIMWPYGPSNNSANFMERITLSSDYATFDGRTNYGGHLTGKWIGLVPSWKAELDKVNPDHQAQLTSSADCYKWLGGDEWYNNP